MYGLDPENAMSRASFVQVPSCRSARRQMKQVFCSFRLYSILKFSPIFWPTSNRTLPPPPSETEARERLRKPETDRVP